MKKIVVLLLLITALMSQSAHTWAHAGNRYSQSNNDYSQPYNRFDSTYERRDFYPPQHLRFYNGPQYRYWNNDNHRHPRHHFRRCVHQRFR